MLGKPHRPAAGFSFNKDRERWEENKISKLVSDIFYLKPHPIFYKDRKSQLKNKQAPAKL
jgi:hypothetical protein